MVASSHPSLATNVATRGSASSANHVAKSTTKPLAPIGRGNPQVSGEIHSLTCQPNGGLPCAGAWVADGQYQGVDVALNNARSDSTSRDVCARHRDIQQACLGSNSNATIIQLLRTSNTVDLATRLADGGRNASSLPTCTCDAIIEVDGDSESRSFPEANGERGAK